MPASQSKMPWDNLLFLLIVACLGLVMGFCSGCSSTPKPKVVNCIPDTESGQCVGTNADGASFVIEMKHPSFNQ